MGAVTAILCAKELDYKYVISCVVSDSAFSSLSQLIDEFVEKVVSLPQFLINIMKKNVGDIIEKKANFRIEEIEPIKNLEKCNTIPILFCHGLDDTFINSHHCNDLYKKYGGKKEIVMFEGEHNEKRPLHILQIISLFFYNHLKVENIVEISLAYDKKNKETLNTLTYLYDEGEINSNINGIEEEMDITNDEEDRKRDVKSLLVKKSIVKNYFKAG